MILLLAPFVLLIALVIVREVAFAKQRARLEDEVRVSRTELGLLHVAHRSHADKMFTAYREDVQVMAQRIQAPELAVVEHQQANVQDPDAFPLTDEQLSQQQEMAEFIRQAEAIENGLMS